VNFVVLQFLSYHGDVEPRSNQIIDISVASECRRLTCLCEATATFLPYAVRLKDSLLDSKPLTSQLPFPLFPFEIVHPAIPIIPY
jgi:hypothetical protein